MIPSPSSPASSSSFVAGAGQPPTEPNLPETSSGDSVSMKPSFDDDDDFYFLYNGGWGCPGAINQEGMDLLVKNNPGIFDDVDTKILNSFMDEGYEIQTLFDTDPVKYQPIARYIAQGHKGCLSACVMKYGEYKGGFYSVGSDYEGTEEVYVHSDHYELAKENKLFVSQLREFLFDKTMSSNDKIVNLQMLFPPSEDDVSIEQLRTNMDFLFGNAFKQAKQRAINSGLKP